jgi:hypothetical protein
LTYFVTAKITHTTLSHIELLQALLSAFGMPMYTKKKVLLLDTLREFFLQKNKEGKPQCAGARRITTAIMYRYC